MTVPSVDTTTYNRFLLSAGIALVALGLLTPTLLLQVSSEPFLGSNERERLSQPSLSLLERREDLIDRAFDTVWPVSGVLIVGGVAALASGARRARQRQFASDKKEDLEILDLENRVRGASLEEQNSKLDAEVAETVQEEIEEGLKGDGIEGDRARARESSTKADYVNAELLALNRLAEAFPSGQVHQRIAIEGATGSLLVDGLVRFDNGSALLVEVKFLLTPSTTRGRDNARRLLASVEAYESSTNRAARGLLVYALPPLLARSPSRADFETRLVERTYEGWTPDARAKILVLVIGTDELEATTPHELAERIAQIGGPSDGAAR